MRLAATSYVIASIGLDGSITGQIKAQRSTPSALHHLGCPPEIIFAVIKFRLLDLVLSGMQ